jgi:hypothetical protein
MNAILLTSRKDTHLLKGDEISGIAGAYPIIQENRSLNLDYFLDYPSPEVDLYDLVGEVSLGWYGNDGVSTGKSQEISISAMLNRRILVELSSALRYYFAFIKYTNKYDKILISNNIPDSLSLVSECFVDSVEFFHSDNEFDRHITPSPLRGLVSEPSIHIFFSKILRILQRPFLRYLKGKVLIINDWTYKKVKNANCLNINKFNPIRTFCLRSGLEYLNYAEQIFPHDIDRGSISYNIEKILVGFNIDSSIKCDLVNLFTKIVQKEYLEHREKFIKIYCAYREMFEYYEPSMIVSPGYSTAEYQVLCRIARLKQVPIMFVQDGFMLSLDKYLFMYNKNQVTDYFAIMGDYVGDLYRSIFDDIKTIKIYPPVVQTHRAKKDKGVGRSAIVLFPYGYIFSPYCRWDKKYKYVIDVVDVLSNLGYKDIKVKMKPGFEPFNRETENQLMRDLLDKNNHIDVKMIFGEFSDYLRDSSLVIGQMSTAIIEAVYQETPYYVYEPYSLGFTEKMIRESILGISTISRDTYELKKKILDENDVRLDKGKIFNGIKLNDLDYKKLINDYHNKKISTIFKFTS